MNKLDNRIEIEGVSGLVSFIGAISLLVALLIGLPTLVCWVVWNALVGDLMSGPYISFLQALPLTLALLIGFKVIFQPEIQFEIHRIPPPKN